MFNVKLHGSVEYNDSLAELMAVTRQITNAHIPSQEELDELLLQTTALEV